MSDLKNHWRWLRRWHPQAQQAMDRVCQQFPIEVRQRGLARAYYEFLWNVDEILKVLPGGLAGMEVMDIGCGAGVQGLALRYLGARVTALDRFEEYEDTYDNQMGNIREIMARLQANGIVIDRRDFVAEGLPDEPSRYDLITLFAVIEHLHESPKSLLQAIYRLLKPGGHVVITTPNHAWVRTRLRLLVGRSAYHSLGEWWQMPFFGHVREYTLSELTTVLTWAGFQVKRATIRNWWHVSSRIRGRDGEPERWTTRFTLDSPERWLVMASLLVSALIPSLGYSILAIGCKPDNVLE